MSKESDYDISDLLEQMINKIVGMNEIANAEYFQGDDFNQYEAEETYVNAYI